MIFNCRIAEKTSDLKSAGPRKPKNIRGTYENVRQATRRLCAPLCPEDCVIQSMPDASPTRWHLAHTTWFFETFVLAETVDNYKPFHPDYYYLFNSYYNAVGAQFPRPDRGVLSRPAMADIDAYRLHVDQMMRELLGSTSRLSDDLVRTIEIGLHHEQQHQELILTDIKNAFSLNPILPVYCKRLPMSKSATISMGWCDYPEGLYWIGHAGGGFGYDHEFPRHRVFLESFELAKRPVTNGEYMEFMADGGYENSQLWLSEGWQAVRSGGWTAPLYWFREGDDRVSYTLSGRRSIDPNEPVCHVSYFEADAFARWRGCRLPREAEWEIATADVKACGNFVEGGLFHPVSAVERPGDRMPQQMYGDVWEWTSSPYIGYPGYQPPPGAIGEYNGKFMCNQFVLRGGSCVTPASHIRHTYRNFFQPSARWQFSGIRLAR